MKIAIAGVDTHYQVIGTGSHRLVLLHGWGCDWQVWAPVIPQLSETYQLIIPDLPAFGHSTAPQEVWDSFDYVQWLAQFLHQVAGDQKFSLAGHSFGGKIAALYAAQDSSPHSQLEKVIIIDASGLPVALTPKEQLTRHLSQLLPAGLKNKLSPTFKTQVLKKVGVATDYQHANAYQQAVLKKIVREQIDQHLKKIAVPVLVIWGKNDQATPLDKGREFARHIPQAQLVIMNQSGHYPFVDETASFIKAVTTFL